MFENVAAIKPIGKSIPKHCRKSKHFIFWDDRNNFAYYTVPDDVPVPMQIKVSRKVNKFPTSGMYFLLTQEIYRKLNVAMKEVDPSSQLAENFAKIKATLKRIGGGDIQSGINLLPSVSEIDNVSVIL